MKPYASGVFAPPSSPTRRLPASPTPESGPAEPHEVFTRSNDMAKPDKMPDVRRHDVSSHVAGRGLGSVGIAFAAFNVALLAAAAIKKGLDR